MSYEYPKHPVGTTWTATDLDGNLGTVWLSKRYTEGILTGLELYKWKLTTSAGEPLYCDEEFRVLEGFATSYENATITARHWMNLPGRFVKSKILTTEL